MATSNPRKILKTLNKHLSEPTELTIFGRAALNLGFASPVGAEASALTKDVDVLVASEDEKALDQNNQFWQALDKTNAELEPSGLYLTHIFLDRQTILRPDWKSRRAKIKIDGLDNLVLWRPDTIDLILTKMTRSSDPDDREDIYQLLTTQQVQKQEMERAIQVARCPELPDIQEQFQIGQRLIKDYYLKLEKSPNQSPGTKRKVKRFKPPGF